jgi:DNA-binding MarR family transcriptional regulator
VVNDRPSITTSHAEAARTAILATADELRRTLTALLEPLGITLQQYNVLRILRDAHPDPLTTRSLGERLAERTPGTTRLLERLERKGLVRRARPAANRRIVHCRIEPAGLELVRRADQCTGVLDPAIGRSLDPDQLNAVLAALAAIRSVNKSS